MTAPRFAAALSTLEDTREAAVEACELARLRLDEAVNLAVVFASFSHQPQFDVLAQIADVELAADCLIGCTGESIACNGREIEGQPALAVWLAHLPDVALVPMRLEFERTPDGGGFSGWPEGLNDDWPAGASLLLLGEPFSFPADVLLSRLDHDHPGTPVAGGMASGGWGERQNRLLFGSQAFDSGAVGVLMHGPLSIANVVSQGCRPIGRTFVVTKAERNVIFELGGKPAIAQLQEVFDGLSSDDQQLARRGLHVGQVIDEYRDAFGRGDFLVRNVQGVDAKSGAIAIGDYVRVGQTVQFHVRDAQTADEDLNALVAGVAAGQPPGSAGAVVHLQRPRHAPISSSRITTPRRSRIIGPAHPWPASSPKARSAPSAAKISCTATPPASRCSGRAEKRIAGARAEERCRLATARLVNDVPRGRARLRRACRARCRGR